MQINFPDTRFLMPKVKRGRPSMGARPTMERAMPRAPANRPFIMLVPDSTPIRLRENRVIMKYSYAPKCSANRAREGARKVSTAQLKIVPRKENTTPTPRALLASPFAAIGAPSKVVATDAGVPGMLIRMAEIKPPEMPPTNRAINRANAE